MLFMYMLAIHSGGMKMQGSGEWVGSGLCVYRRGRGLPCDTGKLQNPFHTCTTIYKKCTHALNFSTQDVEYLTRKEDAER